PFKMEKARETSFPDYAITIEKTGAVKGGTTLCTEAINKAIEQTSKRGGGKVIIPAGLWLSGPITLLSNVDLHLEKGAIVAFTTDMSQYPIVETTYEGQPARKCLSPLNAKNAENIAITGYGIFDGQGEPWRQLKK
ncbi:glycoside hydrolase family 28 protein, partial [Parabacteroides distasonis]